MDLPAAEAMMVRENSISTAYSAGPKFRANLAMGWATMMRTTELNIQPKAEEYRAVLMALPAMPCLARA